MTAADREPDQVTVRNYRPSDLSACRGLARQLTEVHRELYHDPTIGGVDLGKHFDDELAKVGPENIWVAVSGSNVVGYTGLIAGGDEGELEPLIVDKGYRGEGVGGLLAMRVIDEAKRAGLKYLNVRPVARNAEAIRFFKSHGFDKVGRVELFIDFTNKKWGRSMALLDHEFKM